ncbi:MAG: bifunctional serine/threonine-protein kinase/formylglycine-generating enzyme family protein [Xanthomonadales bacterium]
MSAGPQPLPPGSRIEELRIDAVLGQGAFGVTYRATDTRLDTTCVIKEYLPRDRVSRSPDGDLSAVDAAAREEFDRGRDAFMAEGRTAARLDHPNIARVLRCIEANGTAYLVMAWYPGETLHRLLQRSGTLDEDEALALAEPLLDALAYLHGQGLIHRDLKPSNIYVTQEGAPLLLDFGAAAAAPGQVLGSSGYAAPEQYGVGGNVGPWTDIYGLSATLYRCIGGHLPAPADARVAAVGDGLEDPLTPLDRLVAAADFQRVLPAIGRGLAIDPRRRPADIAAWRSGFGMPSGAGATPNAIAPEEREWLPMILLGLFVVVLSAALIYLFAGGAGSNGSVQEPQATADASAGPQPEEDARWKSALEADVAYGYRQFMRDYPESIHNDQARLHLGRLDDAAWARASETGTRAALEAYLEQFPEGRHRFDADIALNELSRAEAAADRAAAERAEQDDADWAQAQRAGTAAAVDAYLAAWPDGQHAAEARELRASIEAAANDRRAFEAAARLNTLEAYRAYTEAFPGGRHLAAALEAIDSLTLRPGKVFRDCADCPDMVVVPAGSYWQGSDESAPLALKKETPKRMVTFAEPFAVSVFEITFAQWDRCVADGGCSTQPVDNGWGRGDRPVMMVSWNDAQEYTAWLSRLTGQAYSLPSESQWEYVARAGEETDWLGGNPAEVCRFGNIAGRESGFRWEHEDCADATSLQTLPVGSLEPNAFGVYDVIGNVAEWTLDCMNLSYLDAPADGSAWSRGICSSRMTRGGSWFTGTREIRLPARFNLKNGDRNDFTGFRVVRTVEPD